MMMMRMMILTMTIVMMMALNRYNVGSFDTFREAAQGAGSKPKRVAELMRRLLVPLLRDFGGASVTTYAPPAQVPAIVEALEREVGSVAAQVV